MNKDTINNKITTKMNIKDNLINVIRVNKIDYISLTDLARYKNPNSPGDVVIKWMSNKSSFDFYSLWEGLFNEDFKLAESREFKNDAGNNSFTMSPSRWINSTNSKGFISKRGKHDGGTFAHPDIALEFASWIDPAFKLYLIQEFERLKYNETLHLVVLSNLELLNASMIENNINQKERLERLNAIAKRQINILAKDTNIIGITKLDKTKLIGSEKE